MSESENLDVELPLVPTAEEQDELTWRDDIRFRAAEHAAREWIVTKERPEPSVAIYAAAKAAVEARDRDLARRIEDMPSAIHWPEGNEGVEGVEDWENLVSRADVLQLLEGKP